MDTSPRFQQRVNFQQMVNTAFPWMGLSGLSWRTLLVYEVSGNLHSITNYDSQVELAVNFTARICCSRTVWATGLKKPRKGELRILCYCPKQLEELFAGERQTDFVVGKEVLIDVPSVRRLSFSEVIEKPPFWDGRKRTRRRRVLSLDFQLSSSSITLYTPLSM